MVYSFSVVFIFSLIATYAFEQIIYVAKNGTDSVECGSAIEPCGSMYYASTKMRLIYNGSTLYVYGQNETIIQSYVDILTMPNNSQNLSHPCLPKSHIFNTSATFVCAFDPAKAATSCSSVGSLQYSIVFDDSIKLMNDWFPMDICNTPYLIDLLKRKHHGVFFNQFTDRVTTSPIINFYNLRIDNYQFSGLKLLGNSDHYRHGIYFFCYNCHFQNTIVICSSNSSIFSSLVSATRIALFDSFISNFTVICDDYEVSSIFDGVSELSADEPFIINNAVIDNVWVEHSLLKTGRKLLTVNNSIFNNIHTGVDIFGEYLFPNINIIIYNTTFSYIDESIYLSINRLLVTGKLTRFHVENVNIIVDQVDTIHALFELNAQTIAEFNYIYIYYEYNLSLYCEPPRFYLISTYDSMVTFCSNHQQFFRTYGRCILSHISFDSNIDDMDNLIKHHELLSHESGISMDNFNVTYYYKGIDFLSDGLISNLGINTFKMQLQYITI
eukprot:496018_1